MINPTEGIQFISARKLAEILGLSYTFVRDELVKREGFPSRYRFGGAYRWELRDVMEWVRARRG